MDYIGGGGSDGGGEGTNQERGSWASETISGVQIKYNFSNNLTILD